MILATALTVILLPQQPIDADALQAVMESARVDHRIPGMALAVVRDGALVFAEGFGLADMEAMRAADADTLFAIGSTTKAFTTTLLAMLGEEGRIGWDDPVLQHLPEFRLAPRGGEAGDVTIRDLVCHRTGFTRMGVLWAAGFVGSDRVLAQATHAEPWAGFRKSFHYNNVMYLAAGSAAAAAGGAPWATQVRLRILEPLGMESTFLTEAEYLGQSRLAAGYEWDEDRSDWRRLPMRSVDRVAPAGAIVSSVNDMSRWVRLLLAGGEADGNRLISEAALHETWEPQINVGGETDYAMGWFVHPWRGRTVVQHGGNIDGFAAQVAMIPEQRLGYVLLSNVTATPLQSSSIDLVFRTILDPQPGEAASEVGEDFSRFVGEYDADFAAFQNRMFEVRIEKGKLAVDVPGQMLFVLKPVNEDGKRPFELTDAIAVEFEEDAAGTVRALRMHQAGHVFRLPRKGAAPADWEPTLISDPGPTTGRYFFAPTDQDWKVITQEGILVVDVPGQTQYELGDADDEGWRLFRAMPSVSVRFTPSESEPVQMDYRELSGGEVTLLRRGPLEAEGAALPTLTAVVAQYDAPKRAAAMEALGGLRLQAEVRLVHQGATGAAELRLTPDGRFLQRIDFGEFGTIVEGMDPARALVWSAGDFGPYDELKGVSLEEKLGTDPRAQFVDLFSAYGPAAVLGIEEVAGEECVVISLPRSSGGRDKAWLTRSHADVVRLDTSLTIPGAGSLPVKLRYSDFREIGGIRIPHVIVSENSESGRSALTITGLEAGVTFTDRDFAPPR